MPTINIIDNNRNMSTTSGGGFAQMGAGAIPGMMQGMPMGQSMAQTGGGLGLAAPMMRPMMPRFGGMMPMAPMGMRMPGYMMAQTESDAVSDVASVGDGEIGGEHLATY